VRDLLLQLSFRRVLFVLGNLQVERDDGGRLKLIPEWRLQVAASLRFKAEVGRVSNQYVGQRLVPPLSSLARRAQMPPNPGRSCREASPPRPRSAYQHALGRVLGISRIVQQLVDVTAECQGLYLPLKQRTMRAAQVNGRGLVLKQSDTPRSMVESARALTLLSRLSRETESPEVVLGSKAIASALAYSLRNRGYIRLTL
jgi:hypothetical protein